MITKISFWLLMLQIGCGMCATGQGYLLFLIAGDGATRIGTPDGSLADDNYLGQLLAGPGEDSMEPIGVPLAHVVRDGVGTGAILGFATEVPTVKPGEQASVKFVAWDRRAWGDTYEAVPNEFLGMTDTITLPLSFENVGPPLSPTTFPRGAVVPIIPEASMSYLILFGSLFIFAHGLYARKKSSNDL